MLGEKAGPRLVERSGNGTAEAEGLRGELSGLERGEAEQMDSVQPFCGVRQQGAPNGILWL